MGLRKRRIEPSAPDPIVPLSPQPALQMPDFLTEDSKPDARDQRPEKAIVEAEFTPIKATISLANLTIKGALNLANKGSVAAQDIAVRTSIISASENVDQAISAFHSGGVPPANHIGDAGSGEVIKMEIDLIIPLHELKTYALREQKLFVPIVLVNIGYGLQSARQELFLSCLIGRELIPPRPKMAPFRLDLGPRSITPLGQRPLSTPLPA